MLRMAAIFPQRKEQLIYLINNYDLILGILMERTRDNTKEAEAFREQLSARSNEYVEEILSPHIGGIIHFVKECENQSVSWSFFELNQFVLLIISFRAKIWSDKNVDQRHLFKASQQTGRKRLKISTEKFSYHSPLWWRVSLFCNSPSPNLCNTTIDSISFWCRPFERS